MCTYVQTGGSPGVLQGKLVRGRKNHILQLLMIKCQRGLFRQQQCINVMKMKENQILLAAIE